jgi:hypothetical protein
LRGREGYENVPPIGTPIRLPSGEAVDYMIDYMLRILADLFILSPIIFAAWIAMGGPGYQWCMRHLKWYRWVFLKLRWYVEMTEVSKRSDVERITELEAQVEDYKLAFEALHYVMEIDPDDIEFAVAKWKKLKGRV